MPTRNVYHVVPSDSRWGIRLEGSPALSYECDDRDDAVRRASGYVRQFGAGRIVVHNDAGQIETVHTYDQLPPEHGSWRDAVFSEPVYVALAVAGLVALGAGLAWRARS